ncbi:chaperone modulator CbpM [Chitinophagaceae bacterium MMS25-I14]
MDKELIIAEEYCRQYNVDISFIESLEDYGLIHIEIQQQQRVIPVQELRTLERYIRLHYDLDINMEGLEAIAHLLQKVKDMQQEIAALRSWLSLYGEEGI